MLIRPRFINSDDYFPKLRTLDEYAHIDFINGITKYIMPNYRNIDALYHFTPILNIPSILRYGILSRDQCENKKNIIFYNLFGLCTDRNRYDGRKDCISCSINKPYYNMLSNKRKYFKRFGGIAILKINKAIINEANCAFFSDGNAAKKENSSKKYEELSDPNIILDENNLYKTDAEILIKDHIPLKYIDSFNFSTCDLSYYMWANLCKFYSGKWFLNFQINNAIFGKYYTE